jgi:NitT/TauT family transport system substrate-binding protein
MTRISNFIAKALLGVAAGAIVFGVAAQAQELRDVNVVMPNDSSCGMYPEWNATIFGFWPEAGIKVNILPSETTVPYVAFLQNGDADIVTLDSAQVLQAADVGLPIKVVYEAMQYAPEGIYVVADSPIQGLEDLHDITIGMASDRDLITTIIAMSSIGKTLEDANITTVVVGDSGPVMATALRDNTIQALAGSNSDYAGVVAAGIQIRDVTPPAVSRNPGNSFTVWGPTLEDKREMIEAFVKGWAMAQHAAVLDTKTSASACATAVPEQFENREVGFNLINENAFVQQIRRTKDFGELQPDVWASIQPAFLNIGEISKEIDPDTFLDASFIEAANSWTTDEVKRGLDAWREANPDKIIY